AEGLSALHVDRAHAAGDVIEVGAGFRARIAPRLVEEDAIVHDGGEAELRAIAAHGVDGGAGRDEGRRGVHPEGTAPPVVVERALDLPELDGEVVARDRAP